jgi:hypothetical protein
MTDDDNDNDDTPHERIVTDSERIRHYAQYPPGTPPVREFPSAPHNLFDAQIQERVQHLESDVESLTASRRNWRWIVGLAAPAILAVMAWWGSQVIANSERVGGTSAEIKALGRQIENLEGEIKELRAVLLKISGISGKPITIVRTGDHPNRRLP